MPCRDTSRPFEPQILADSTPNLPHDTYGNETQQSGTSQTTFGFTGEETDSNGLLNLRARYYSPGIGQFLNLDPLETANRFAYTSGNPVNRRDPSGLCPIDVDMALSNNFNKAAQVARISLGADGEKVAAIIEQPKLLASAQVVLCEVKSAYQTLGTSANALLDNFHHVLDPLGNLADIPPEDVVEIEIIVAAAATIAGVDLLVTVGLAAAALAVPLVLLYLAGQSGLPTTDTENQSKGQLVEPTPSNNCNNDCLEGSSPQDAALQYASTARDMGNYLIARGATLGIRDPERYLRIVFAVSRVRVNGQCTDIAAINNIYGYLATSKIDWQNEVRQMILAKWPTYLANLELGQKGVSPSLTSGHAETNLYNKVSSIGGLQSLRAIGVSHPGGPCDGNTNDSANCRLFFSGKGITIGWYARDGGSHTLS